MKRILLLGLILWWAIAGSGQPLYSFDFSNGFPQGWTTGDEGSNTVPTLWEVCTEPEQCPPATLFLFDRRAFRNDFPGPYIFAEGNATASAPFASFLQTQAFDFTNQAQVWLRFESVIATVNFHPFDHALLRIKVGDGEWEAIQPFCQYENAVVSEVVRSPNAETRLIDLTPYVAGEDEVLIQWYWRGLGEFVWAIDKVEFWGEFPEASRTVWGLGPGEGQFDEGLGGWTTTASPTGSSCPWTTHPFGEMTTSPSATDSFVFYLPSPTGCNGAARLLLDSCTRNSGALCPPCPDYRMALISPRIDLSGESEPLLLEFFQGYHLFDSNPELIRISYSLDDGSSWEPISGIQEELYPNFEISQWYFRQEQLRLPSEVSGVAEVRLRFEFSGKLYAWALDDVRILRRQPVDLALKAPHFTYPPNRIAPVGVQQPFLFRTDVFNFGGQPVTDATVHLEVLDLDRSVVYFADSMDISPVGVNENVRDLEVTGFEFPEREGEYLGRFFTKHPLDQTTANDTVLFQFTIQNDRLAKEAGGASGRTIGGVPYEVGNCFFIAGDGQYQAESIVFGVANANQLGGRRYSVQLYRWDGSLSSSGSVQLANSAGVEFLAGNSDQFEFTNAANTLVRLPFVEPVLLENGYYYFATVRFDSEAPPVFVQTSRAIGYEKTFLSTAGFDQTEYAGIGRARPQDDFNMVGFGLSFTPVVRLELAPYMSATDAIFSSSVQVAPNPVRHHLTVFLDEAEGVKGVVIRNTEGKVFYTSRLNRPSGDPLEIAVGELPPGHYWLEIETQGHLRIGSFVKL